MHTGKKQTKTPQKPASQGKGIHFNTGLTVTDQSRLSWDGLEEYSAGKH